MRISLSELKHILHYDSETGIFSYCDKIRRAPAIMVDGYVQVAVKGKTIKAHRVAWFYMTGKWPEDDIDHVNRIRHDNRWKNLRACSRSQNMANAKIPVTNTSGLKGVSLKAGRKKWTSTVGLNNKTSHLGTFDCPAAAHFAYLIAADMHFGEFARAQ